MFGAFFSFRRKMPPYPVLYPYFSPTIQTRRVALKSGSTMGKFKRADEQDHCDILIVSFPMVYVVSRELLNKI